MDKYEENQLRQMSPPRATVSPTECCIMSKDVLRSRSICTEHVSLAASTKQLLVTLNSRFSVLRIRFQLTVFLHVLRTEMGFSKFHRAHLKKCSNINLSPVSLDKHTVVDHHRDLYLRLYVLLFYKKELFQPICLSAVCYCL